MGEEYEDVDYQDEVESNALCDLLETEVVPLFYQRNATGLPAGWIVRMKEAIAALAPAFSANRMVREYAEVLYLPNHERWEQLNNDRKRIEALTRWKAHVRANWAQVHIEQRFPRGDAHRQT